MTRPWSLRMTGLALAALFAALYLWPAAVLAPAVVKNGAGALAEFAESGRPWRLMWNSLATSLGASALATVLGAAAGAALFYARAYARRTLAALLIIPFLVPAYVYATAYIDLFGKRGLLRGDAQPMDLPSLYSLGGVIVVLGFSLFPVVLASTAAGVFRLEGRLIEAASLQRGGGAVFLRVALPLLAPYVATGALIVFLLSLVDFAAPSLLQVNTYPVEIHARFSAFHDIGGAAALALPLLLMGGAALWAAGWIWRRAGRTASDASPAPHAVFPPTIRGAAALACLLLLALTAGLPVAVIIERSMPLSTYADIWRFASDEMAHSALLAAAAATGVTAWGAAAALLWRDGARGAWPYRFAVAGFLVSPPVAGIALIQTWNRPGLPAMVFDSLAILAVAYAFRFLFIPYLGMRAHLRRTDPALHEAAALAGIHWFRRWLGIDLPLAAPVLLVLWSLTFALCFTEAGAGVLVAPPGFTPLPVLLFGRMHYGPDREIMALSVLLVVCVVLVVAAGAGAARVAARWVHGRA